MFLIMKNYEFWIGSLVFTLCYKFNEAVLLEYPFNSLVLSIVNMFVKCFIQGLGDGSGRVSPRECKAWI